MEYVCIAIGVIIGICCLIAPFFKDHEACKPK